MLGHAAVQDDPHLGIRELKAVTDGAPRSMLVGITCGISAAYVLGQIEHGMATDRCVVPLVVARRAALAEGGLSHRLLLHGSSMATVLMGFNPPELARNMPVDGWDKTCRGACPRFCCTACDGTDSVHALTACTDVALALQRASDKDNILLTPVVGPEPITGSTRMKGGTATKILLVRSCGGGSVAALPLTHTRLVALWVLRNWFSGWPFVACTVSPCIRWSRCNEARRTPERRPRMATTQRLSLATRAPGTQLAKSACSTLWPLTRLYHGCVGAYGRFHEIATVLQGYEITMRRTYLFQRGTGDLAALAGESLKSGGCVGRGMARVCLCVRSYLAAVYLVGCVVTLGIFTTLAAASVGSWDLLTLRRCRTRACARRRFLVWPQPCLLRRHDCPRTT